MIIKMQSLLLPYARPKEEKKGTVLTKSDRINADRIIMGLLLLVAIVTAILFS